MLSGKLDGVTGLKLTVGVLLLVLLSIAGATTTEKPAKQTPPPTTTPAPPPPPTEDPFADMEILDYVRSGALVVAFLATIFAGQDVWFLANLIFVAVFGTVCYLFPEPMIAHGMKGKMDAVHLYHVQQFGAAMLGLAVVAHFARKSRQEGVRTSFLLSNLLGGSLLLQSMLLDYFKSAGDSQRLSDQQMSFTAVGCGLWVVGNFIAVMKAGSFGGSIVAMKSCLTKHLLVDVIFYTSVSFFTYGYPDVHLSLFSLKNFRPDGVHAHMVRSLSALAFTQVIFAFQAMGFSDDKDKQVVFLSRLAVYASALPVGFLYQWRYQMFTNNVFIIALAVSAVPMINALLAYFGPISLPKFKRN